MAYATLAFGAVHPSGWIPVAVAAGVLGVLAAVKWRARDAFPRGLCACLAVLLLAIGLQLVPLPDDVIRSLSPGTDRFLLNYRLAYDRHPLSLNPRGTWIALALVAAFGSLMLGLISSLTLKQARAIADGVVVFAAGLSVLAIVQRAALGRQLYGIWTVAGSDPFGPFVNKNHFAGWMLMALALATGRLFDRAAHVAPPVSATWRAGVLWLGSRRGMAIILTSLAIALMNLALAQTLSRSGITCAVAAQLALAALAITHQPTAARKKLVAAGLAVMLAWPLLDVGPAQLRQRFTATWADDLAERSRAWVDAARIARDFPAVGTGVNSYGIATLLYRDPALTHHYNAAHNDFLQVAAEGGLLVGAPALMLVVVLLVSVVRRFTWNHDGSWLRAGAGIGLLAVGAQELVDFSLQIPANALLCVVLAAVAAAPLRHRRGGLLHGNQKLLRRGGVRLGLSLVPKHAGSGYRRAASTD